MRKTTRLEYQANQIELALTAQVTGGRVTPNWVRFRVTPLPGENIEALRRLVQRSQQDISARLGVPVKVKTGQNGLELEADRAACERIAVTNLVCNLAQPPRLTAVLGLTEQPSLLLLDLQRTRHLLITGEAGQGKTTLLGAACLSLAMLNRQRDIQFVAAGSLKSRMANWPHLLAWVGLTELAEEIAPERILNDKPNPHLVVVIDDLERLRDADIERLKRLLEFEDKAGIHVLTSTTNGADLTKMFPAVAAATAERGVFELRSESYKTPLHAASAATAEIEQVITRLRAGRQTRQWTFEDVQSSRNGWTKFLRWRK